MGILVEIWDRLGQDLQPVSVLICRTEFHFCLFHFSDDKLYFLNFFEKPISSLEGVTISSVPKNSLFPIRYPL